MGEVNKRFAQGSTVVTGGVGIQAPAVGLQECVHISKTAQKITVGWWWFIVTFGLRIRCLNY